MFKNILHQSNIIDRLKTDITTGSLPPAILFSGPENSGKGSAALELCRVLGCELEAKEQGAWNCQCPSCLRHRNLVSPDLLLLGRRRFFEEASASAKAFINTADNSSGKTFFIRSIRKLLGRFNGILWEGDPKYGKLKPQIEILEEELEDIAGNLKENFDKEALEKKCGQIIKKAAKLETEGLGEYIPIARIRKASYWSRLSPIGRHKCLIIENAEKMQEGAKNALLKTLEEPSPHVVIILTCGRPANLLPTMLSRLREYRFSVRSIEAEMEVLERIFRKAPGTAPCSIDSYLTSFLPVSSETLYNLGAFFTGSAAMQALREGKGNGSDSAVAANLKIHEDLKNFAAPIAENGGIKLSVSNAKTVINKTLDAAGQFEISGIFNRFLRQCCNILSAWVRSPGQNKEFAIEKTLCAESWLRELNVSMEMHDVYNIAPPMALERLFESIKKI